MIRTIQPYRRLQISLLLACLTGYGWICANLIAREHSTGMTVCLVKRSTGLPCPSCGSTRSVMLLCQGEFSAAFHANPLGYVLGLVLLLLPAALIAELFSRKTFLSDAGLFLVSHIKRPYLAWPLATLMLINWIWNIYKGI